MKILYLTPGCFDKGGISRYSRYQITALRELYGDSQVRVLSLLAPDAHGFEDAFNVRWHGSGAGLCSKIAFSLKAASECLGWRPDVIHSAHVNLSGLAAALSLPLRAKTLLNTYGLEMWSGLSRDALWGLRKTQVVMSDCHATADYIEAQGWRESGGVPVIWDCADLDRFTPGECPVSVRERYGIPLTGFVILTLGRLSRAAAHKGYERLLEVFARVAPCVPDAVLVFAGRGDLRDPLSQQAEALGLSSRVIFTGSVAEEDLPNLYRAASVFSLVSDRGTGRGEGIPLTPLEAMACGIPIIVGDQDGSREAVIENQNGYVVDPFNLARHAEVLVSLAEDPALRGALAAGALKVAQSHFSYEGFRDKHQTLYQQFT